MNAVLYLVEKQLKDLKQGDFILIKRNEKGNIIVEAKFGLNKKKEGK